MAQPLRWGQAPGNRPPLQASPSFNPRGPPVGYGYPPQHGAAVGPGPGSVSVTPGAPYGQPNGSPGGSAYPAPYPQTAPEPLAGRYINDAPYARAPGGPPPSAAGLHMDGQGYGAGYAGMSAGPAEPPQQQQQQQQQQQPIPQYGRQQQQQRQMPTAGPSAVPARGLPSAGVDGYPAPSPGPGAGMNGSSHTVRANGRSTPVASASAGPRTAVKREEDEAGTPPARARPLFCVVCANNQVRCAGRVRTGAELILVPQSLRIDPWRRTTSFSASFAADGDLAQHPDGPPHSNAKFRVISSGTGSAVRLPGPSVNQPNIYAFGTPYEDMYQELSRKDPKLCVGDPFS